jgi:DNA modification methylase
MLQSDQAYAVHFGDCILHMREMPPASMDLSVYSPPFPAVYAYTDAAADLGNSEELKHEAKIHFSYFFRAIRRVIKPGRVMAVHCQQIVRMKRSGEEGMFDFRGLLIRLAVRAGFVYEYDWLIRKNPQAQAIRTKSRQLQFAGIESDRTQSRGAMGDYLIKFRVPGDNTVPVVGQNQVSRNQWIEWAEACWSDIRETDTLNVSEGRGEDDTKHICALQLGVINRLVRLYSNPGEIVFSPFAGIGSEGFESVRLGRRFYGCELKPEYHAAALKNLDLATKLAAEEQATLFAPPAGRRSRVVA